METEANSRRELKRDMRAALIEGGFEIHYQPLCDVRSEEIVVRCCAGGIRAAA